MTYFYAFEQIFMYRSDDRVLRIHKIHLCLTAKIFHYSKKSNSHFRRMQDLRYVGTCGVLVGFELSIIHVSRLFHVENTLPFYSDGTIHASRLLSKEINALP